MTDRTARYFLIEGADVIAHSSLPDLLEWIEAIDVPLYRAYDAAGQIIELTIDDNGAVQAVETGRLDVDGLSSALRAFLAGTVNVEEGASLESLTSEMSAI